MRKTICLFLILNHFFACVCICSQNFEYIKNNFLFLQTVSEAATVSTEAENNFKFTILTLFQFVRF